MADNSICSIPLCGKPRVARGWCAGHYSRWKYHGDVNPDAPLGSTRARPQCTVSGCQNPHVAKGLCGTHYSRKQKHGDVNAVRREGRNITWLKSHIKFAGDDCLNWPFGLNAYGYGSLRVDGKSRPANRVMCELAHGAPPHTSMQAAHQCGNPACVNPQHLRWATPIENNADKRAHGTVIQGADHPHAKLTELEVLDVLKRLDSGEAVKLVASRYSVSWMCIDRIRTGKTWGWLTGRG